MAVIASVPSPHSRLFANFRKLLRDAETSIEMTMAYFAPPEDLVAQLCRSARNGVRVRLMLPGRSDVAILVTAARAFYETLMDAGVEIYERQQLVLPPRRFASIDASLHCRFDKPDYRSIQFNCELSAVVHSTAFGEQMHELFEHDVRFARQIDSDEWRHRPIKDRISAGSCVHGILLKNLMRSSALYDVAHRPVRKRSL